jgi:hypothetical protein
MTAITVRNREELALVIDVFTPEEWVSIRLEGTNFTYEAEKGVLDSRRNRERVLNGVRRLPIKFWG